MLKQFVTCEIAIKLKDLGFDEPCFGYFNPDEELIYGIDIKIIKYVHKYHKEDDSVLAPLWQQAIDWLRENYKISIEIYYPINSDLTFTGESEYCVQFIDKGARECLYFLTKRRCCYKGY